MATWLSTASRAASLLTVAAVAAALNACTPKPNGPEPTAEKFFAALATGDTAAAAELSRQAGRREVCAQRGVGGAAGGAVGRADPGFEIRRGHRQRHLPLHLAPAEEPDMGLRRAAEHGPRRGAVGGSVERHWFASAARRAPDLRAACRPAAAGVGQRARRHRRAGARQPVPLRAGREVGRRRVDADRSRRG